MGNHMEEVKDVHDFIDVVVQELSRGNSMILFGIDEEVSTEEIMKFTAQELGVDSPTEVVMGEFLEEMKPLVLLIRSMQGLVGIPQVLIHTALTKDGVVIHVIMNGIVSYNMLIGLTHEYYYLLKLNVENKKQSTFIKTKATPVSMVITPLMGGNNEP